MVGVKQEETGLYLSPCGILNGGTAGFLEGVQRQYSGTAARIENCLIGIFMVYGSTNGHHWLRVLDWACDLAGPVVPAMPPHCLPVPDVTSALTFDTLGIDRIHLWLTEPALDALFIPSFTRLSMTGCDR
jgi:hypothetical protein